MTTQMWHPPRPKRQQRSPWRIANSTADTGSTRPTELPPSVSYGSAVMVSGLEEECLTSAAGTTTRDSDDTLRVRDFEMECKVTNSDPRLAGTGYYTGNVDRWMSSATEGVQLQWGTIRIENDGVAWETEYLGIYSDTTGDVGAELYVGTGDYEGLYYYQWVVGTFDPPWPTQGVIFPATVALPQSLVPSLTPPDR